MFEAAHLIIALLAAAAAEDRFVYVERAKLDCVVAQSRAYLKDAKDPLLIHLNRCRPRVEVRDAYPGLRGKTSKKPDRVRPDVVISLTREQLSCFAREPAALKRMVFPDDRSLYQIPVAFECDKG
jgi:hypothetical protein